MFFLILASLLMSTATGFSFKSKGGEVRADINSEGEVDTPSSFSVAQEAGSHHVAHGSSVVQPQQASGLIITIHHNIYVGGVHAKRIGGKPILLEGLDEMSPVGRVLFTVNYHGLCKEEDDLIPDVAGGQPLQKSDTRAFKTVARTDVLLCNVRK